MSIKIGSKVEVLFFEEQACDATKIVLENQEKFSP